jgi:signal transduction histidine kinase
VSDQKKTKQQLIDELSRLRQENEQLWATNTELNQTLEEMKAHQQYLSAQLIKRTTDLVEINKDLQQAIFKRQHVEETLHKNIAELQARNEELDAFSYTVAHDLQNPIGIITGMAEILNEDLGQLSLESLHRYFQAIVRSGRKANTIVEELLLLAQLRRQDVEKTPLDMAAIIAEVQIRLDHIISDYAAQVILPETWPVALGYAPWVEEVWTNYFTNAIKYGGTPPRLQLGATPVQVPGFIRFWVRDNGPGLSAPEREKLFTPFTQLNQYQLKGYGLGLSIVKRIIKKLGGQAGVESRTDAPDQGSTFYFCLPAAAIETQHSD